MSEIKGKYPMGAVLIPDEQGNIGPKELKQFYADNMNCNKDVKAMRGVRQDFLTEQQKFLDIKATNGNTGPLRASIKEIIEAKKLDTAARSKKYDLK